jgi:predicted ATP-dependent protease
VPRARVDRFLLAPERLAWRCPPGWLPFETTAELSGDGDDVGGQPGAIAAIELGIGIAAPGYNVFVAGAPGTGRTSTVRRVVERAAAAGPVPDDLAYVFNFDDPRAPRALRLPPGTGRVLRDRLAALAESVNHGLAALRASGTHRRRRDRVAKGLRGRQSSVVAEFQAEVAKQGFGLVEVAMGPYRMHDLVPLVGGQPVGLAELPAQVKDGKLTQAEADRLAAQHPLLAARLAETSATLKELGEKLDEALATVDREAAEPMIVTGLAEVRQALGVPEGQREALDEYLAAVHAFLLEFVPIAFAAGDRAAAGVEGSDDIAERGPAVAMAVNVVVDRSGQAGRPIVEETYPTAGRLLGTIETQRGPDGGLRADLGGIRAGALQRADGGFLLLNAHDLLAEDGAWSALRRTLRTGLAAPAAPFAGEGPPPLVPQPIPVAATVILVGTPALRDAMAQGDEEFAKLFKVTALFDERIPLTAEAALSYARFLGRVCAAERLLPFEAAAVGRILEHLARVAGGSGKISTRFRWLADLAREASWFARDGGAPRVARGHVEQALGARREREGLLSGRVHESIREGALRLEVTGERIGQANALAVIETNLERFGYPVRVTATASVGRSGIIDIEREAELSGEIHTKASLILAGYLRSLFAQRHPLAVTASTCFEQSYGGVEGDSASGAELVALLSALARAPVRQDLALTGAVDQHGQVLTVGGINEKVEGFWRVCRDRGFSGTQGVIVPAAAAGALQLDAAVVADAARGCFRVYAASTVDDLCRLLLRMPLGTPDAQGEWPAGSLGRRVDDRLREMADSMRAFGRPDAD